MAEMDEFMERMRLAMLASATAQAEANRLDERRKMVRAQLVKFFRAEGKAVGESEHLAMASDRYEAAVQEHYLADLEAGTKRAEADFLRIKWDTWRTRAANRRAERTA